VEMTCDASLEKVISCRSSGRGLWRAQMRVLRVVLRVRIRNSVESRLRPVRHDASPTEEPQGAVHIVVSCSGGGGGGGV